MVKRLIKQLLRGAARAATFPLVLWCGRGRRHAAFQGAGQLLSLIPGTPGNYLRMGFYYQTLESCGQEGCISFLSFFAHPQARLGEGVYIGPFTVIGRARIGDRCQIATGVQILSGSHQHARTASGAITGADAGTFEVVEIEADVWIGASAVVMANVGAGATVGAGAVVTKPVAPGVTAVGVPARPLAPR